MKTPYFISLLITILLAGCTDKPVANFTGEKKQATKTPEIFSESKLDYTWSSKRGNADFISQLYEEALKKDKSLRSIDEKISEVSQHKYSELQPFHRYNESNKNYWLQAALYIKRIQDPDLQATASALFQKMEAAYINQMVPYEANIVSIEKKATSLNDQRVLMQLLVSAQMMETYQKNEKPDIKELVEVDNKFDKVLEEMMAFIPIAK